MTHKLLTSAEVAKILGVTAGSVKRWADLGLLRCARTVGRHRRFDPVEVERFLKDQTGAVQPGPSPLGRSPPGSSPRSTAARTR